MEANFARVLQFTGVPYEHEPRKFHLPSGAYWTPDFYLHQSLGDLVPAGWVELKGWQLGATGEKLREFGQMTGESVFVICFRDALWTKIQHAYRGQVPWETPRRNLRTRPDLFGVGLGQQT